ncbi:MAG: hypothetical protein AAFY24_01855 [Pseudomonadota bacterium]
MFNALQAIQAGEMGTRARERREYKNALSQAGEAFSGGDYTGAANALLPHDLGAGMQMVQYGQQQEQMAADQAKAAERQQLESAMALNDNLLSIPEAQRGEFLMQNWQQFEPIMGTDFMTFWQQSGGDVSDATLQQEGAVLRTQLGISPEAPEAPAATSTIGKISQDLQNEFITQEQADAAIAKANTPRGPLAQVTVEGDAPPPLPTNKTLTPLQQKMDDGYADLLVKWNIGGAGDTVKQLDQLGVVADRLESGENVTGFLLGNMPDWMLAGLNPQAMDTKELVQEVVQRSLRDTLGAQFTEREGEMLLARAYNPRLDEKLNAARLRRLISTIESRAQQINSLNEYMGRNGTSQGWDGSIMSATQILSEMDQAADGANTPQSGQKRRVFNPATGEFES